MSQIVNLSEAALIALHGMVLIARNKELTNVLDISENTQTSRHHVAKVMQRLVKSGFLTSHRGPLGGFELKRPANQISLLDIYEAIEGKLDVVVCPLEQQVCPFDKCLMNNITHQLTLQFRKFMNEQYLSQYIEHKLPFHDAPKKT